MDAGLAVAATVALALMWVLVVVRVVKAFAQSLGVSLNSGRGPLGCEWVLLGVMVMVALVVHVTLVWLAWTHHLWLSLAAQLALPICTFLWVRFAREN
ncbi:hypothetical protein [Streptomyces mesophilus]|uniref:hypothetical protein n=1 Tax=Streptomyces mesophilus TaxID=1775132 RepID=UPI00332E3B58